MATPIGYTKIGTVAYTDKGAYDPYTTYNKYNVVLYEASSWVCQQDGVQGITPVEGAQWHLVARGYNLQFDEVPTKNSPNVVRSGGIFNALADLNTRKQDVLINASILSQIGGITNTIIASSFIPTSGAVKEAIDNIPGGTGGSNVIVTTTETSLYGKRVRITQGSNFYETDFDGNGVAEFTGITMTGDVVISSTDGTDTAQRIVNLPYFGNYDFSISFWTATLHITTTYAIFNGQQVKAVLNGSVVGTATFSPSSTAGIYEASINVSEQGSYKVQCVYGWRTFESNTVSVSEETTYEVTLAGFTATLNLSTTTDEFKNLPIAVTLEGEPDASTTINFTNGTATYIALKEGTYKFTVTYDNELYEFIQVVSAQTTYSLAMNMWTATLQISTNSSRLHGRTITVKKNGANVGTTTFNNSGQATFKVHETGTYNVEATDVDNYTYQNSVAVSAETSYPVALTVYTLNISTSSDTLYGKTITVKKNGTTIGTTVFSALGTAAFYVGETGTYDLECDGYTSQATIVTGTYSYNVEINAGLDLASWISAGSTTEHPLNPSSYADFDALEADEEAIRQLMTVHASVDYLAQATAGDSLMESIIGSDVCAKWINLRDYALDTLYANSDIADVMDTADKYGYGEWVENNGTWGAKGNVPIMTANNAPYGTAFADAESTSYEASKAFDNNAATFWYPGNASANHSIGYTFTSPIKIKRIHFVIPDRATRVSKYKIQGSNDGWSTIAYDSGELTNNKLEDTVDINADTYCLSWRMIVTQTDGTNITTLQFYGRELKPLVPVMTDYNKPKGEVISSSGFSSGYEGWRAFDGDDSFTGNHYAIYNGENAYVGYKFDEPVIVKSIAFKGHGQSNYKYACSIVLKNSIDGNAYTEIATKTQTADDTLVKKVYDISSNTDTALGFRLDIVGYNYYNPNSSSKGCMFNYLQFYGSDYSEKEFAQDSNRLTIYDHGLSFVTFDEYLDSGSITYEPDQIYVVNLATNHSTKITTLVDYGTNKYSMQGMTLGNKMIGVGDANAVYNTSMSSAIATAVLNTKYTNALDVSGISGENRATGITLYGGEGTFTIAEWWLE